MKNRPVKSRPTAKTPRPDPANPANLRDRVLVDCVVLRVPLSAEHLDNALTQAEMNRARIETAQTSKDLSAQRLDAEQTKFNLGTSTLRFVLEEQRNVAQAETNELQATVNFTKSLVDLDRAMGLTLKKNNVEVEKTLQPVYASTRQAVTAVEN